MNEKDNLPRGERRYPQLYERVIPIALAIIVAAIAVLLLIILAVVLRTIPGAG